MVIHKPRIITMRQTHKVKDNSKIEKKDLSDISNLISKIADKTLKQLEHEGVFVFPDTISVANDIVDNQTILQSLDYCYQTSNVMGFLGFNNEQLVIESRFSNNEKDYFLLYLLEKALNEPNVVQLFISANQENKLFNFLLFLFPYYLKKAMRKGPFKVYVCNKYNDANIRGRIDIPRHIKKNTPFTGKVAYVQREFSYDNHLMELIRHTIDFIQQKPYSALLNKVNNEVQMVIDSTFTFNRYDKQKIIQLNKKKTVRHAYFYEYRSLQRLCLAILENRKHQIGYGKQQIHGILFDGAWLWEEYINSLIGDYFYHPLNRSNKGAQYLFSGHRGLIFPDFISSYMDQKIIADAKYKTNQNISNKDYLQVLAYMFRFDANIGFFIYPEVHEKDSECLHLNSGTEFEHNVVKREDILVIKHGLRIPQGVYDYNTFSKLMNISEKKFRTQLLDYCRDIKKKK